MAATLSLMPLLRAAEAFNHTSRLEPANDTGWHVTEPSPHGWTAETRRAAASFLPKQDLLKKNCGILNVRRIQRLQFNQVALGGDWVDPV